MATISGAHRRHALRSTGVRWRRPFELRHLLLASVVLGILFHLLAPVPSRHPAPDPMSAAPWDVR